MDEGLLLFRNLAFFRKIEDKVRGDELEGLHMDMPVNGFHIILQNGQRLKAKQFTNCINPERVFAFCLSTALDQKLFDEFKSDVCIKITNVPSFLTRCSQIISSISGTTHFAFGPVEYYHFDRKTERNIKDPKNIPLFKHSAYSHQREFRIYFSLGDALQLTKHIIIEGNPFGLPQDTSPKSEPELVARTVRLGPLHSIAEVIRRDSICT